MSAKHSGRSDFTGADGTLLVDEHVSAEVTLPSGAAARPSNYPPHLLGGRFVLEQSLGEGGMGVVYAARDTSLDQRVALKMLNLLGARAAERMKREFRSLADVAHPNLVGLYELFFDEGHWFFTMELVRGVPFDEFFSRAAQPSYPLIAEKFGQLADGILALHDASKLHRDLKPPNVMVRDDGQVVILDFGLVEDVGGAEVGQSFSGEAIAGTPAFMAPEQIFDHALPASDWYAFGSMLYEALTGELPFDGTLQEVLAAKCGYVAPPPPSSRQPGIPPDLEALCVGLLAPRPEDRPPPSRILDVLGRTAPALTSTHAPEGEPLPFVGREAELSTLQEAFAAVERGELRCVLIHGVSGMGKTTLAMRFLDTLAGRGALVLRGRCYERESVPYKAFDSLLEMLVRHLRRLPRKRVEAMVPSNVDALKLAFPIFHEVEAFFGSHHGRLPADAHEARQLAFQALKELLCRLADRSPVVMFIDDLQWADLDSVNLLSHVFGPPDLPPLLLLGCYRPGAEGAGPVVSALQQEQELHEAMRVEELEVAPLGLPELTQIAFGVVDDDALARRAAAEAAGSPLFAAELARFARMAGQSARMGGARNTWAGPESVTFQDVILHRLSRLPRTARELLDLVAVAGRPVPLTVLRTAAGSFAGAALRAGCPTGATLTDESSDIHAAVNLLRGQQLARSAVSAARTAIECSHDRILEAVLSEVSPSKAKGCHLALGRAYEAVGGVEPQVLATHFLEAEIHGEARRYAVLAADAASAALAFGRAAHWYAIALELDTRAEDADAVRVQLADALTGAGRGSEAAAHYMAAAQREKGQTALELRRRAADQLLRSGHFDRGFAALDAVLSDVNLPRYATTARALPRLLRNRVLLRFKNYRATHTDAPAPSRELLKVDACRVAATAFTRINFVIGATYATDELLLALEAGEPSRIAHALCTEAMFLSTVGISEDRRASSLLERARPLVEQVNEPALRGYFLAACGTVEFLMGRWEASIEATERAEEAFRERCIGVDWERAFARTIWMPAVQVHRSLSEPTVKLEEWLREARELNNLEAMRQLLIGRAYSYLALDRPEDARATIEEGLRVWVPRELDSPGCYALFAGSSSLHYARSGTHEVVAHLARLDDFFRSPMSRCQNFRLHAAFYRAGCELVLAQSAPSASRRWIRSASARGRRMCEEGVTYGACFGFLTLAQAALLEGNAPRAVRLLQQAAAAADQARSLIVASSCRYWLGSLLGGDEGDKLVRAAHDSLSKSGCLQPARIAATYGPVFDRMGGA